MAQGAQGLKAALLAVLHDLVQVIWRDTLLAWAPLAQPRSTKLPSRGMMWSGCASSTFGRLVWLAASAAFSPIALHEECCFHHLLKRSGWRCLVRP